MIKATVSPTNATNKGVKWTSSNNDVASVDTNGVVTAKSAGNATITATTDDGGKTAVCTVKVSEKSTGIAAVLELFRNILSRLLQMFNIFNWFFK